MKAMKTVTIELSGLAANELQLKASDRNVSVDELCEAVLEGYAAQGQSFLDRFIDGWCCSLKAGRAASSTSS